MGCGPTARRGTDTRRSACSSSDRSGVVSWSDPSPVICKAGGVSLPLEVEHALTAVSVSQSINRRSRGRDIGRGIGEKDCCIVAFLSIAVGEEPALFFPGFAPTGRLEMLRTEGAVDTDAGETEGSIVGSADNAWGVTGVGGVGGGGGALIGGDSGDDRGDGDSGECLIRGVGGVGGAARVIGPGVPGGDTS